MSRIMWALALLLAALALAAAGCGDDDDDDGGNGGGATEETGGGGGGGQTLQVAAPEDGSLRFTESSWTVPAGQVTIEFDNPSSVPHAVEVEGQGVEEESEEVTQGNTSLTVDLEPGTYELYCPVGGHREAGMTGTLTVE